MIPNAKTARVGLIGRGMAAKVFHAPLIRAVPRLDLVATCGLRDMPAMLADDAIDLVTIATPNETHSDLVEAALVAGKHVVVDKPFAITAAESRRLIDLARHERRMLTVFHNRRWDGDFLTVRRLLAEDVFGEIALFEAAWDRFRPDIKAGWRETEGAGTGLLWDLGPHLIDQMLLLFGRPDSVMADVAHQRSTARVDDYFALTFHYGERRAMLSASTLVQTPRPRFAMQGMAGSFVKFGLDPQEDALKAGNDPAEAGFGADAPARYGRLTGVDVPTEDGRYLAFYEGVADAVLEGATPPVDPADASDVVFLIERSKESARLGRRVTLDWSPA